MTYNPTKWNNGAAPGISAALLNNLESQYAAVKEELGNHNGELWTALKSADGLNSGLDADKFQGFGTTHFATASALSFHESNKNNPHDVDYAQTGALGAEQTAVNSNKLEGYSATHFATASDVYTKSQSDSRYLGKSATAENSSQLQGHSASYFATANDVYTKSQADSRYYKSNSITYGTGSPSGGSNGDIYIQY